MNVSISIAASAVRTPRRRGLALIRVSLERDGTTSPEVQRHSIQTYADAENIEIIDWVEGVDEAKYSGSRKKSAWWPKLSGSIDRIESGEADVIVVWKFSRAARNRLRWAVAVDRIETAGGALLSATEHVEATPSGRFARGIHAEMNAYQAEIIGENWREAHERRRRQGLPPTGGARFGYRELQQARPDGRMFTVGYEPDPVTGPFVADLYRRYLGGMGIAQLTRFANESGVREKAWSYQGLMNVLDSGFPAGLLGRTRIREGESYLRIPVWERDFTPGVHPALIDVDTWHAYIARRRGRSFKPTRSARKYLLTGLVRCGDCGGTMSGKTFDGRPTYICSRSQTTTVIKRVSMVAWRVDKIVEDWILELSRNIEARAEAVASQQVKVDKNVSVRDNLRKQIDDAVDGLTTLTVKLATGKITDEAYRLATDALAAERDALEARYQLAAVNPVEHAAPLDLPADLAELWPHMTNDEKSLVVRPFLEAVVIYPAPHKGSVDRKVEIIPSWHPESGTAI